VSFSGLANLPMSPISAAIANASTQPIPAALISKGM
jgi:hypothetical protein